MKKIQNTFLLFLALACSNEDSVQPTSGDNIGSGGSLARFTISGNHLYAVDEYQMVTFSLADAMSPSKVDAFDLNWGVETIFAMDTIVFVGTQTGMHMFDISTQSRPAYLANYAHVQSCDPVVAQDTLAFVTLRSENFCRDGVNRLDVIDIRDLKNPKLIAEYAMQNPHGLAVKGDLLFVSEGNYGMKVYRIGSGGALELIKFYNEIRSKDLILQPDSLLIVVADDGLFQYSYQDVDNIALFSQIDVAF